MSNWINVETQYPTISDKLYLVCLNNRFILISYFYRDSYGKHWGDPYNPWENEYDDYVTHWQEIPDLPDEYIVQDIIE